MAWRVQPVGGDRYAVVATRRNQRGRFVLDVYHDRHEAVQAAIKANRKRYPYDRAQKELSCDTLTR